MFILFWYLTNLQFALPTSTIEASTYQHNQALITVVILGPLALAVYHDAPEFTGAILFFATITWFVALIVLVSDKKLRRVIHDEGQQYFASNNTNSIPTRTISEAASEIGLGSGPFLGIVVTDVLNM